MNYSLDDVKRIVETERAYWCARLDCTEVIANLNATHRAAHSPDLTEDLLWFSKSWLENAKKYNEIFGERYEEIAKLRKEAISMIREYREKHSQHIKTEEEK